MSKSIRKMKQEKKKKDQQKDLLRELKYKKRIEEEKRKLQEESTEKSLLLEICRDDIELYYVLSRTMFINQERFVGEKYDHHVEIARKYKKEGNLAGARQHFHIAAGIGLYRGNPNYARGSFCVLSNLVDPDSELRKIYKFFLKEKNLIKAMKSVKEFYDKSLKS